MWAAVDGYCERLGPGLWAEPLNAISNLAFLLAALVMARKVRHRGVAMLLCAELALIGVGSGLFHTLAVEWAGVADVIPILLFILTYLYAAHRFFWRQRAAVSLLMTGLFLPYAALTVPLFSRIAVLGSSAAYAPVPLLILIHAVLLRRRLPAVAWGLGGGGAVLILSLTARTLDMPMCPAVPQGTHFLWHLLNALMLGWMIEVLRRHQAADGRAMLAAGQAGR